VDSCFRGNDEQKGRLFKVLIGYHAAIC